MPVPTIITGFIGPAGSFIMDGFTPQEMYISKIWRRRGGRFRAGVHAPARRAAREFRGGGARRENLTAPARRPIWRRRGNRGRAGAVKSRAGAVKSRAGAAKSCAGAVKSRVGACRFHLYLYGAVVNTCCMLVRVLGARYLWGAMVLRVR